MFNDSDHQRDTTLTATQIRLEIENISSDLEDAFTAAVDAEYGRGSGWYALDRLHAVAARADAVLRGEVM